MPTDLQTELHNAITTYRAYLETGERCTRPLYRDPGDGSGYVPDGDVECVCVRGVHGTEQLRTLRTRLGKAVEGARAEPSLRPALDALPGGCYGFNSLMDFTVNPPAIAASFRAQATAFDPFTQCEYVCADILRALDRALARLPGDAEKSEKAPAGGENGGSMTQRIEVKDSPGTMVNQFIGSSNRASQNQAKEGFLQQIGRQIIRWFSLLFSRPSKPKGS